MEKKKVFKFFTIFEYEEEQTYLRQCINLAGNSFRYRASAITILKDVNPKM